jgi:hypothetical protein
MFACGYVSVCGLMSVCDGMSVVVCESEYILVKLHECDCM